MAFFTCYAAASNSELQKFIIRLLAILTIWLLCDNNHSALTVQEFVMKKTFTFSLLAIVFASLLSACVPHHHHRHSDGPRGPAASGKPMPPSNGGPNHGSPGHSRY